MSGAHGTPWEAAAAQAAVQNQAEKCDGCKQLLTGMDRISHTAFHWQALAIAQEYLKPPKESK